MGSEENNNQSGLGAQQPQTATVPLTAGQRHAIQQDQINLLKMQQLSGEDAEKVKSSSGEGEINENEAHLMHIKINQKQHDQANKSYKNSWRTVKINVGQYQQMLIDRSFTTYDAVKILHDPRSEEQIKAFDNLHDSIKQKRAGKKSK